MFKEEDSAGSSFHEESESRRRPASTPADQRRQTILGDWDFRATNPVEALKLPQEIEDTIAAIDVSDAVTFVREGSFLMKYPRIAHFRHAKSRLFKIDMDLLVLRWQSPKKPMERTFIKLAMIHSIRPGLNSRFFQVNK